MLSKQDNELMCHTGAGTAMGDAMRRFWLPAMQLSDMPAAGAARKVIELLGESIQYWRAQAGTPGVCSQACLPQRALLQLDPPAGTGLARP